jgi:hypothetical protein
VTGALRRGGGLRRVPGEAGRTRRARGLVTRAAGGGPNRLPTPPLLYRLGARSPLPESGGEAAGAAGRGSPERPVVTECARGWVCRGGGGCGGPQVRKSQLAVLLTCCFAALCDLR